jgi:hypothetical protein
MFELAELFFVLETVAKGNDMNVATIIEKAKAGKMTRQDLKELGDTIHEMRHEPYHWTVWLLLDLIRRKQDGAPYECGVIGCKCSHADGNGVCHLKGRECPENDKYDNPL